MFFAHESAAEVVGDNTLQQRCCSKHQKRQNLNAESNLSYVHRMACRASQSPFNVFADSFSLRCDSFCTSHFIFNDTPVASHSCTVVVTSACNTVVGVGCSDAFVARVGIPSRRAVLRVLF
jgi:hypothetical protein